MGGIYIKMIAIANFAHADGVRKKGAGWAAKL
jgi:hypothetical protein